MATTKKDLSSRERAAAEKRKRKNAVRKANQPHLVLPKPKRKPAAKKPTAREQAVIDAVSEVNAAQEVHDFNADQIKANIAEATKRSIAKASKAPGVTTYVLDHKAAAEALATGRLK